MTNPNLLAYLERFTQLSVDYAHLIHSPGPVTESDLSRLKAYAKELSDLALEYGVALHDAASALEASKVLS